MDILGQLGVYRNHNRPSSLILHTLNYWELLWPLYSYLGILFHLLPSSYSATVPKLAKSTAPIFKAAKNVTFQDWIGKWCTYLIHKVGVWLSASFAFASRNTQCAWFNISSSSLIYPFTFTSCSYRACSTKSNILYNNTNIRVKLYTG